MATVVTSIDSIERIPDGSVTISLQSGGEQLAISFPKNALTELFVILTSLPSPESGLPFDLSPIRALGVSPFGRTDGTAGLLLNCRGGGGFHLQFPPRRFQE
jgi:hypothetical protein